MKKILNIILIIGLILASGCAKSDNLTQATEANSSLNKTDSANVTIAEIIDNSCFFKNNVSQLNYKGNFSFDENIEKDVKLYINTLANLKYGKLYELKLDCIEDIPNDRLSLGYFYVQKDKIYKIEPTEENYSRLKTSEEMPKDSVIVCQDKEIKDSLGSDELGLHQYIKVYGNKREYHSYNNQVSTGYYETFIWEKNKGLINYRSGYGAESDSIELQLKND